MIISVAKRPDGRPVSNWGIVPVATALLPLADFVLRLGPPRPVISPLIASAVMLAVFWLIFRFSLHFKPKTLSRLLVVFVVAFGCFGVSYVATEAEYVGDRPGSSGRPERIVLGYALKSDLQKQIKTEADAAVAERERERDPLQNAASVNGPPGQSPKNESRDADKATPFKTEDQVRDEYVSQLVNTTGDPTAPYTESSIRVVSFGLLLLWLAMFGCVAAAAGILTVASKLVLRRDALNPRAV
jgi:hypothetical protein